jgi:16S rRNA (guanine(966)-N(2))-methyltransferase RsmD
LKGRRIRVPKGLEIRPTADRVREALFSILGQRVDGARVLDLFAGTGALGLEALSRGAVEVVFVEVDRGIARTLESTVIELGVADACRVVQADVLTASDRLNLGDPFQIVLADPPYGCGLADRVPGLVSRRNWLVREGCLVVERPSADPAHQPGTDDPVLTRSARYGGTRLDFYGLPGEA